jgi:hypothetical protein
MQNTVTRPVFIIGNKRSGTSQLVRLLNLHPQVFISHESDVVWILYQFHNGQPFRAHASDSDKGMLLTLDRCSDLLQRDRSPWENFLAVQRRLMEDGTPWLPPVNKQELCWMGDKKPFQQTDPQLSSFILENFPDAHFLHIVRHPFAVVASSQRFNQTGNGDFWLGLSQEEKMERWTFHEKQVQALQTVVKDRVHSLRFEDLCRDTEHELSAVFRFLGLSPSPDLLKEASRQTLPAPNVLAAIRCSEETRNVARHYGYSVERQSNLLRTWGESIFAWAIRKRIR